MKVEVIETDITTLAVDAIVNAANESLLGGGGVDGAIHRAAGPALLAACRALPEVRRGVRCPTGEARYTPGFNLPAPFVIHTVGPVWHGGHRGEPGLLADCYKNCLKIAQRLSHDSIAFPAISAGIYGYPPEAAAEVAVTTIRNAEWAPARVVFCTFGARMTDIYRALL
ncbi:O-acetyl-ADP-ribose deacetylase [Luteibacter jiangsuensis]|jgi:O-acetyl-ADP-ribose deacetylase (regulator of RNase III)